MKPTEPAGRMAFKNYILMTIVGGSLEKTDLYQISFSTPQE
jgi:hypothetical protein